LFSVGNVGLFVAAAGGVPVAGAEDASALTAGAGVSSVLTAGAGVSVTAAEDSSATTGTGAGVSALTAAGDGTSAGDGASVSMGELKRDETVWEPILVAGTFTLKPKPETDVRVRKRVERRMIYVSLR
jgi:hypothetical protein